MIIFIKQEKPLDYSKDIATTDVNIFRPIHFYNTESIDIGLNGYQKIKINTSLYKSSRRYTILEYNLAYSKYLEPFIYKYQTLPIKIYYTQQYIVDENNNILYCLAIDNNCIEANRDSKIEISNDKLRLYLSIDFTRNPKYKNLYKKLSESFINKFLDEGIEVVIKSSENIDKDIFSTNFVTPSFNTVEEAEEHLKSGIENLLIEETTPDTEIPF